VRSAARARLLVLSSSAISSTGGAAIKLCGLSAVQVAGLRAGVAAVVLAILLRPPAPSWRGAAAAVGIAQGAMMLSFVVANKLTTAASTIFLQATAPLYVVVLAPVLLRERTRARDLAYLAVFAAGLAAFFVGTDAVQETAPDPALGNLVAAASGAGWAATILGLRWLAASAGREDPSRSSRDHATGADPAIAAVILANAFVFVACLPWTLPLPTSIGARDWLAVAWLGVVQIALAYALLTRGVRDVPAFEASLLVLVEPVLSPVWAWLVHGERPGPWSLAGGALILGATAARSLTDRRP